jgi:parvulin-like peptidyl-prolyl isomerase
MKKLFVFLFFTCCALKINAQEIPSSAQALKFLSEQAEPVIFDITEDHETFRLLKDAMPGDIIIKEQHVYKVLKFKLTTAYNAGYIFLDKAKLSEKEFNELYKKIMSEYNAGASFKELAVKYTMDKSPDSWEYKFIDGQTVPEFESAVRAHSAGEVFTVDTPSKKWFHIVKKNEENRRLRAVTVEYGHYR